MLRRLSSSRSRSSPAWKRLRKVAAPPAIADPAARATAMAPALIRAAIMAVTFGRGTSALQATGAAPGVIAATRRITVRCLAADGADLKWGRPKSRPYLFRDAHLRSGISAENCEKKADAGVPQPRRPPPPLKMCGIQQQRQQHPFEDRTRFDANGRHAMRWPRWRPSQMRCYAAVPADLRLNVTKKHQRL